MAGISFFSDVDESDDFLELILVVEEDLLVDFIVLLWLSLSVVDVGIGEEGIDNLVEEEAKEGDLIGDIDLDGEVKVEKCDCCLLFNNFVISSLWHITAHSAWTTLCSNVRFSLRTPEGY